MFKRGDRVECVGNDGAGLLKEGKVYVVEGVDLEGMVAVEGVPGTWFSFRFEAIPEDPATVPPTDNVNSPSHYKQGGVELIDVIEAFGLNYGRATLVAYVVRAQRKGSELEDLKKARWYLEREIRKLEAVTTK